ncbi:winged helix-turn-helix domain-containing protein [Halobaculum rubrum]|uniref:winged helix-turn-helix domain-containing protein n=1 Tax=Halobaculum rubrum TaxID=2872158 RepID=UPI001CA42663|nr:helix-turn-helix domain-containing protein [Halobaculum rubrum]QZX99273.1 helix-turn-helix domain-containing protein [Halobaculum rubrum]
MVRDSRPGADPGPSLQPVLDALDDEDCRTIIKHLEEPLTAGEVSEECEIPMSTTYRKLDLLSEAQLLAEGVEVRQDGHHATRYRTDFDEVIVAIAEDRTLDVEIERPTADAADRLATMWGEVRRGTDQ